MLCVLTAMQHYINITKIRITNFINYQHIIKYHIYFSNRIIQIIKYQNRNTNRKSLMMQSKPIFSKSKQLSVRSLNFDDPTFTPIKGHVQNLDENLEDIDNIIEIQSKQNLSITRSQLQNQYTNEDLSYSIVEDVALELLDKQQLQKKQPSKEHSQNKQNVNPFKKMTVNEIKKNNCGLNCSEFLFCSEIPQKNQANNKYITFQEFKTKSSNLDLLLFKNNNNVSKLQRFLTKSDFDHVAMVVEISHRRFILESDSKNGVCLCDFQKFIQSLEKRISTLEMPNYELGYRRFLQENYNKERYAKMIENQQAFVRRVVGKKYKFNPLYLISEQYQKKSETYFCSELIAECLQQINLIKFEKPTYSILPRDFSPKTINEDSDMEIISDKEGQIDIISKIYSSVKIVNFKNSTKKI